jgi:hypothetical protein
MRRRTDGSVRRTENLPIVSTRGGMITSTSLGGTGKIITAASGGFSPARTRELPDYTRELPEYTRELPEYTRELPDYTRGTAGVHAGTAGVHA